MKQNISKAAKANGISASLAHNRIKMGWSYEDAVSRPTRKYKQAANTLTKPKNKQHDTSERFSQKAQLKLFADGHAARQAQLDMFDAQTSKRRDWASVALVASVAGLIAYVIYASVTG
mgnify:FL=1|tara:strand:+ start:1726 stop:2079 length:354 start_codon:yes stop_codon:yes gene_type:complete